MHKKHITPIILTILDGWGYSESIKGNAIKLTHTPFIDRLWKNSAHSLLQASGESVGLPHKQMGNSEVGHTTIGAGRTINQDLVRIQKSIHNRDFFKNITIHHLCKTISKQQTKLHIIGLCSNGGVHSHINHLKAIIDIVKLYKNPICLHIITDGRDTAPKNAIQFIDEINNKIKTYNHMQICSISGRYYSMDRDCRWSRTEKAYNILIEDCINNKKQINNYTDIINQYYTEGISDEFIPPTHIHPGKISHDDGILFFNFRPDRIRQLLHSLTKENFKGFPTKKINNLKIVTFTNYDSSLNIPIVFPPQYNENFFGQIISNYGYKQLRLAETEKYAHVTYFFNGGIEEPFPGEDRELIPSPKVDTYDLAPHMSATQITESIINAINKKTYKIIIVNYANPDMIGHTGNLNATIQSIEFIDQCLKKLFQTIQREAGYFIVTADHGNAELMIDKYGKPCKSHSTNLIPFILAGHRKEHNYQLKPYGSLTDIAPNHSRYYEPKNTQRNEWKIFNY